MVYFFLRTRAAMASSKITTIMPKTHAPEGKPRTKDSAGTGVGVGAGVGCADAGFTAAAVVPYELQ